MWLVRIALLKPYTFVVMALMLLILGVLSIIRMPMDIFPHIKTPVVGVVWSYAGMLPEEMTKRMITIFERAVTTAVPDIEHIDSTTIYGNSVIKLYFHPNANIGFALSQVTALSQTVLRSFPPGAMPPIILSYDASTVPILEMVLSSSYHSEMKLNDVANNFVRTFLATVQGASILTPFGGKVRQVMADINIKALQTYGVAPQNVVDAINQQSVIAPSGTLKLGPFEYFVKLNNSPSSIHEFNHLPFQPPSNKKILISDVAPFRDGFLPQINVVRVNDVRAVLLQIYKSGDASTLEVIKKIKALIPLIKDNIPALIKIAFFEDQSKVVAAAIHGVLIEGAVAGLLTSILILLFLGNIRSTFVVLVSIPLSILASICVLHFTGETINMMTLGGLALAIGILVDDATVEIENINRQFALGKKPFDAIMDGAAEIAAPAFVSTLCICIVFLPMFFLTSITGYMFMPFAKAVIFAVFASYLLSRTLVPTMAKYLITHSSGETTFRFHQQFEHKFERFRDHYTHRLSAILRRPQQFCFWVFCCAGLSIIFLFPILGADFFPRVDASVIDLHIRAQTGSRVEETTKLTSQVEKVVKHIIPASEIESIINNIGISTSPLNLIYRSSTFDGPHDAEMTIALNSKHHSIYDYMETLRDELPKQFPGVSFSFMPADIVSQILNFGLSATIDLQINGFKGSENKIFARKVLHALKSIPGIVDARVKQSQNYPELYLETDRNKAKALGLSEADIIRNVLITLSGSFQTTPNFWLDPNNGVSYAITAMAPQYNMTSLQDLKNIPLRNMDINNPQEILGAVATIKYRQTPAQVSHYNVQEVVNVLADIQHRDIGSVTHDITQMLKKMDQYKPQGSQVMLKGQLKTQHEAFQSLTWGLVFSIVLIYLLIVINFQSWLDPFIIITALPIALCGIVWALFLLNTHLSVPALTGAIMAMGVATANSILMVSFAKKNVLKGMSIHDAVIDAAKTRIRPVLMTALAMILGMLPMALGIGEGAEQNAPLGQAVIGGLSLATLATLFFVPSVFYVLYQHRYLGQKHE
ncbi:MAG: efflux RND transporter permease subunit [Gammaproteobacteria bacterium]|nr:efflux RND transporter permease subunit [Gammaproteobacteria bacterium]